MDQTQAETGQLPTDWKTQGIAQSLSAWAVLVTACAVLVSTSDEGVWVEMNGPPIGPQNNVDGEL